MEKLKAGNPAPAFEATDQDGNKRTLADYAGRKLILYFYPKDNTPGCTAEACSLRDGRDALREMYEIWNEFDGHVRSIMEEEQ